MQKCGASSMNFLHSLVIQIDFLSDYSSPPEIPMNSYNVANDCYGRVSNNLAAIEHDVTLVHFTMAKQNAKRYTYSSYAVKNEIGSNLSVRYIITIM